MLDFSDDLLESSASFFSNPTRSSIWASLVSLLDHFPEVRRFYTYPGTCPSSDLLWTPCNPPTHSSWYPCSPWRVVMMRWSRGLISALQFLNSFPQKWRFHSSILKYAGWIWYYNVWTDTSSCFPSYNWCLSILRVCQVTQFLQWQITLRIHHIGCWRFMQTWKPLTCNILSGKIFIYP